MILGVNVNRIEFTFKVTMDVMSGKCLEDGSENESCFKTGDKNV